MMVTAVASPSRTDTLAGGSQVRDRENGSAGASPSRFDTLERGARVRDRENGSAGASPSRIDAFAVGSLNRDGRSAVGGFDQLAESGCEFGMEAIEPRFVDEADFEHV